MNEANPKFHWLEKIRESLQTDSNLEFLLEYEEASLELLFLELDTYIQKISENQKPIFSTMAFATQFLPNFLVAKISQEMLTPYIVAQVTNHFKPKEAAKIATHFRKDFLGEVAIQAEKKQIALITQDLPFETAFQVMMEMAKKDHFTRLGEIADLIPEPLLHRFLQRFPDKDYIVKIFSHMTDKERMEEAKKKLGFPSV